ncbi:hypothetical protein PPBDW_II1277 [Photobacterium kishitanii]|nr:hypothetical protein PPBDW_II1277 [Photobacterium kishitanii]
MSVTSHFTLKSTQTSSVLFFVNKHCFLPKKTVYKNSIIGFSMAIRNLKNNSKKPWFCECYPQGREGKCLSTKGGINKSYKSLSQIK